MVINVNEEGEILEDTSNPLDSLCEECYEESALFNAIVYGKSVKLCQKCSNLCGAIILNKPTEKQVYESLRPSSKQVLKRATGIEPKKTEKIIKSMSLEDMRQRAKELKLKKEKEELKKQEKEQKEKEKKIISGKSDFLDEKEFLDYLENEISEINTQEKEN